jgi:thiamine-phosphate pyrophosphorylase
MPSLELPRPVLMLVTDRQLAGGEDALVEKVQEAVAGGANAVQLREKDLGEEALEKLAARLRDIIAGRALLLVNGAEVPGTDGVHLPEDAPLVPGAAFGRSVHSAEAARRAEADGASYVIFGPVFETPSHPGGAGAGPDSLREVVAAVGIPVIAIGGVTAARVGGIMDSGVAGVAVIGAILGSPSPHEAARELRRELDRSLHEHHAKRQTSRT